MFLSYPNTFCVTNYEYIEKDQKKIHDKMNIAPRNKNNGHKSKKNSIMQRS